MKFGKIHSRLNLIFLPRMLAIFDLNKNHYAWPKLSLAYLNLKNDVSSKHVMPNPQTLLGFLLLLKAVWIRKDSWENTAFQNEAVPCHFGSYPYVCFKGCVSFPYLWQW